MSATKRATRATPKKARWQDTFLQALALHPDVSKACEVAGVTRSTAYRARQADEDFAVAWIDAHDASLDQLEAALFARAIDTDTTAAIFLLKSHRRETYGDRTKIEHSGTVKHELQAMTDEELDALESRLDAKRRITV